MKPEVGMLSKNDALEYPFYAMEELITAKSISYQILIFYKGECDAVAVLVSLAPGIKSRLEPPPHPVSYKIFRPNFCEIFIY